MPYKGKNLKKNFWKIISKINCKVNLGKRNGKAWSKHYT